MRKLIKQIVHISILGAAVAVMHITLAHVFSDKTVLSEVHFQLAAADYGQPGGSQGSPSGPQGYPSGGPQGYPGGAAPQGYPGNPSQAGQQGNAGDQGSGTAVGDVDGNLKFVPRDYQSSQQVVQPEQPAVNSQSGSVGGMGAPPQDPRSGPSQGGMPPGSMDPSKDSSGMRGK